MRLHQRFVRLPRVFDAARLAEEIAQFDDADWRPHLPLVSVGGDPRNDALKGPMRPTPYLARCPYLQEVLASLRSPVGRTRLMRIDGHSESTPVVDSTYYMVYRARVHVPVMAVTASSDDASIHMQPGEAWVLDPSLAHSIDRKSVV